ncbi:MAG: hypothetical protein EPO11_07815 [Gammaproteobacteria bacterium]|nr:MAG: hypothetical protein EPO11_07815 [Gammaproteobacteria bacterium]
MSYQEFQENWKNFSNLIEKFSGVKDEQLNTLIQRYIEQNILILNDVFSTSIENLSRLEKAKSVNDVICIQAKLTNELNKKLTLSAQRFLNASLGHIADYNEWLKAHCDLATD